MDANSRRLLGLIAEMNVRFQVPVYQRPYSWGHEQCSQLWDDILRTGRRGTGLHFTGSIVTIQDGQLSEQGVSPLLIIDGQQRITTITLLLVALARHAEAHPERARAFSAEEILAGGYLTNHFRTGEDHYKLTLSKGDERDFRALIDALEAGVPWEGGGGRLAENLAFFSRRVEAIDDVDALWHGLTRLEVVSIALTQGTDDPQVIFESMNSTGKDLSVADLVRNFVLMSYPMAEQASLYATFWRPIEDILGTGADFDRAFEDFLRCYLQVVMAPRQLGDRDVYQEFKRYVLFFGFNQNDRMKNLSLRLKRFARYFAATTTHACEDPEVAGALAAISALDATSATPLIVCLLDAHDHHEIARADLLALLGAIESYLMRRAVADLAPSATSAYLSSLVARVEAVRGEEGDVAAALTSMLLLEDAGERRFPSDAEFAHALRSRDMANFAAAKVLLAALEVALGGDGAPHNLIHIMPTRALASDTWSEALGEGGEAAFAAHVSKLGNLTLASIAYDAPEATFAERQELLAQDATKLASDVLAAPSWTPEAIEARTERLCAVALERWARPHQSAEQAAAGRAFRLSERAAQTTEITFADLFAAGLVEMDDALVSVSMLCPGRATVTSTGKIMLANGEMFSEPTAAYVRFLESQGFESQGQSGWLYWRRGDGGPILDALRAELAQRGA